MRLYGHLIRVYRLCASVGSQLLAPELWLLTPELAVSRTSRQNPLQKPMIFADLVQYLQYFNQIVPSPQNPKMKIRPLHFR